MKLEEQVVNAQYVLNAATYSYMRLSGEYEEASKWLEQMNLFVCKLCHVLADKNEPPAEVPFPG